MQIHIRPVARGDKNYVRAIVDQHVTSPAGDWFPVRSADHVYVALLRVTAERRTACTGVVVGARYRQRVVLAHTWTLCVSETFTLEEHRSAHN